MLFRVLRDLADNECIGGVLPIHVRLWADEFYSGPKPMDSEMLLGEIRSRNISMVPILQDVSQLKTVFPQAKWEIFSSNCSTVVYLGSGPTAYDTHKWISDMLGETTIDTRSDSISHGKNGSSNLQNSKAGMMLMKPDQVREMPNRDCILMIDGMKPIYDRKNRPFSTAQWKEAEKAAGERGYTHPVRVIHDKEKDVYKTINSEEKIVMVDKKEEEFYRNAAKNDNHIHFIDLDNEEFLYLNFDEEKEPSIEELQVLIRNSFKKDVSETPVPIDVSEKENRSVQLVTMNKRNQIRKEWNLSGSALECIKRHAKYLSQEEVDLMIRCLDTRIPDKTIKEMLVMDSVHEMKRYLRAYIAVMKQLS